ncbi:MAG: hypothetical protein ABI876_06675 [Bacteroidota bacterium]
MYAIYETLFFDFHYSLIARDSLPARYRYRVVQGSISYAMDDPSVLGGIRKGIIEDFRPRAREGSTLLLYLTPEREAELDVFLNRDKKERYKFFGNFIYVLRNHWGMGWHIPMPPVIWGIQFHGGLPSPHLMFSVGYEGGDAELPLRDGPWIMRDAEINSIE